MITQAELKDLLEYDPLTGVFRWKTHTNKIIPGTIAGSIKNHGYFSIGINGRAFLAHRLAWIYVNGFIPNKMQIDHINGIRTDNRIVNLRLATHSQQKQNLKRNPPKQTGYTGVYVNGSKFQAKICFNYKTKCLGTYDTPEEAYEAYKAAKAELHSFSPVPRQ